MTTLLYKIIFQFFRSIYSTKKNYAYAKEEFFDGFKCQNQLTIFMKTNGIFFHFFKEP